MTVCGCPCQLTATANADAGLRAIGVAHGPPACQAAERFIDAVPHTVDHLIGAIIEMVPVFAARTATARERARQATALGGQATRTG